MLIDWICRTFPCVVDGIGALTPWQSIAFTAGVIMFGYCIALAAFMGYEILGGGEVDED